MAGRRGAGDWAAEGAGAWVHCSREGAGGGPGGIARVPEAGGNRRRKEGKQCISVAERGRRGRAELIATLILCPAAQPSPEPGVAARSRSRSPRRVIWTRILALCVQARPPRGSGHGLGRGAGFLASNRGKAVGEEGGKEVGAAGGQPESGAKRRRWRRPRGGEEARGGRGGEAPARRAARGRAKRGPGREGWVGGRVGGERESNSRTRPERPAQRAQAARLRQALETGGCGGRGLCPSPIPRSGSEVSPARAATALHYAPLSPKWPRY